MNIHDQKITSMTRAETTSRKDAPADASQTPPASEPSARRYDKQQQARPSGTGLLTTLARHNTEGAAPHSGDRCRLLLYTYLTSTKPEPPVRPKQERAFTVTSIHARAGDFQPKLTLFGSTVAGRQVDIRALVSGLIIETGETLREGGQINAGELLLKSTRSIIAPA